MPVDLRGGFAYVIGRLPNGGALLMVRLRSGSCAPSWRFTLYLGSKDGYHPSALPPTINSPAHRKIPRLGLLRPPERPQ